MHTTGSFKDLATNNIITPETRQEFVALKGKIISLKQHFEQQRQNNIATTPEQKSEMKFLYKRYLLLKERIEGAISTPQQQQMQGLMNKKKELQRKLYDYQTAFRIANGHDVRGAEDMGNLKQEYEQYKVNISNKQVKQEISRLEQSY